MPALVGIVCDFETRDGMHSHRASDEYVAAIQGSVGALPLLIPVTRPKLDVDTLLERLDGLLFTGAPSNVAPRHYGAGEPRASTMLDEARDATSLALLKAAIEKGVPTLCICRGFQELNVALGGTLDSHVHERPGALDHREDANAPPEAQYAPRHAVTIMPGGILAALLGTPLPDGGQSFDVMVNSLHSQGIARLAPGLMVEACAPDGLIEAVSLPGAKGFVLGVQWHPEWAPAQDKVSAAIFQAFRRALAA
ncbi:MAG TPA: gamma-glutamyl-gamma-aminobutyrate hydrolase family protein [Rhizomicrobium sp.]|nr:gamma-glutamyl-gamma-aminobutyrate hydrolase family protein [Rhizomicrobium sp.]